MGEVTANLSKWRPLAGAGLIVVLTMAAYLPAVDGDFLMDDDVWVKSEPALPDPTRARIEGRLREIPPIEK